MTQGILELGTVIVGLETRGKEAFVVMREVEFDGKIK